MEPAPAAVRDFEPADVGVAAVLLRSDVGHKLLRHAREPPSQGRAAAAVFTGVFFGIVPIYGFQSLAAMGVAVSSVLM